MADVVTPSSPRPSSELLTRPPLALKTSMPMSRRVLREYLHSTHSANRARYSFLHRGPCLRASRQGSVEMFELGTKLDRVPTTISVLTSLLLPSSGTIATETWIPVTAAIVTKVKVGPVYSVISSINPTSAKGEAVPCSFHGKPVAGDSLRSSASPQDDPSGPPWVTFIHVPSFWFPVPALRGPAPTAYAHSPSGIRKPVDGI